MITSGQILQEALFARIAASNELTAAFAARIDSARVFPYFSFDGVQSFMRDETLQLVEHKIEFSVWADVLAPKDASRLTTALLAQLESLPSLENEGVALIRFAPLTLTAEADAKARAWHTKINFTALTQAAK